ncbi:MAG TPA: UDP-glucose 4-epimerase GalE [Rhodocyclaceae bacterium]
MASAKKILVTGGVGYIGSHTCVSLIEAGYQVVIFDNLSNSRADTVNRIAAISGAEIELVVGDIRDREALIATFNRFEIDAVIHFAGLKSVGDSVNAPLDYYQNNVVGTCQLLEAMTCSRVKSLVFSSSAVVYGSNTPPPLRETAPLNPLSPYGRTKAMVEEILCDLGTSAPDWRITMLRYFNPAGAHPSGNLGEWTSDSTTNLFPLIGQVAAGKRERLKIYGGDYPTVDGTGIRDFIHVMDLAEGHVAALLHQETGPGLHIVNLGTGHATSVLEAITTYGIVCGHPIPYEVTSRRSGDIISSWADPSYAEQLMGWKAKRGLGEICRDAWAWQKNNDSV